MVNPETLQVSQNYPRLNLINPQAYFLKLRNAFSSFRAGDGNLLDLLKKHLSQERETFRFFVDETLDKRKLQTLREKEIKQSMFIANHPVLPLDLSLSEEFLHEFGISNNLGYTQTHFPALRKILEDEFMNFVIYGSKNYFSNRSNITAIRSIGIDMLCESSNHFILESSGGNSSRIINFLKRTGSNMLIYPQGNTRNTEFHLGYFYIAKELKLPIIVARIEDVYKSKIPVVTKQTAVKLLDIVFPEEFEYAEKEELNKQIEQKILFS